jgi:hypothetical protein
VARKQPHASYIALPVEPENEKDQRGAQPGGNPTLKFPAADETKPNDDWAMISGTSAAAPQIAGVCGLMK